MSPMLPRETERQAVEAAGRRVLAYLRLLPMSEERRLELALEIVRDPALQRVEAAHAPARAMAMLRERLREEGGPLASTEHFEPASPLLARGHMVPEEMDRRPWLSLAVRLAQGHARLSARAPLLGLRMLCAMLVAALLLMHLMAPALQ